MIGALHAEQKPSELMASKMNAGQLDALMALMEVYARNGPDQMAEAREEQIKQARATRNTTACRQPHS
jgi:hypothetical protein